MKKSEFNFTLPNHLIAQHPLPERTQSRLLKLDKHNGQTSDLQFKDLLNELTSGDLLVFNNTKVIPARLLAQKSTGGKIEVFIERLLNAHQAKALLKSNKSVKLGSVILFDGQPQLLVTAKQGMFYLVETTGDKTLSELMETYGHMPLPPYITRQADNEDDQRYQTVYADDQQAGAVAAPTAGLHFDDDLLAAIRAKGVETAFATLHVGAGTFQPVKTDDIEAHQMHKEWLSVDQSVCDAVKRTKANGGRVIAVGTTAVRCLETASQQTDNKENQIQAFEGDTEIFIYPGYQFKCVDALITNFHLPESTLVMLVSAMAGRENILAAYQHAVDEQYRFFSYGDAMLIV